MHSAAASLRSMMSPVGLSKTSERLGPFFVLADRTQKQSFVSDLASL